MCKDKRVTSLNKIWDFSFIDITERTDRYSSRRKTLKPEGSSWLLKTNKYIDKLNKYWLCNIMVTVINLCLGWEEDVSYNRD